MIKNKLKSVNYLPDSWGLKKLINVANIIRGTEPGSDSYNSDGVGIRFLRVSDLSTKIRDQIWTNSLNIKTCLLKDIIMTFDGSPGIVKRNMLGAISSGIRIIRSKTDILSNDFLFYVLQSYDVQKVINKYTRGVTIMHSGSSIEHIKILIPPINEQNGISEILNTVNEAIEKLEAVIEYTNKLKMGFTQELLTQGINHTEFKSSQLGRIPVNWELQPLQNLGDIITGSTPSTKQKEYYGDEILFVSPNDIDDRKYIKKTEKKLSKLGFKVSREIPPNSILVVCISSLDGIGKLGISTEVCVTNQQINSVLCNSADPNFLYYSLQYYRNMIKRYATRSSGHFAIINKNEFSKLKIPTPSLKEQRMISSILSRFDEQLESYNSLKEKYEKLKQGFMQVLLTNKVRVRLDGDGLHRIQNS